MKNLSIKNYGLFSQSPVLMPKARGIDQWPNEGGFEPIRNKLMKQNKGVLSHVFDENTAKKYLKNKSSFNAAVLEAKDTMKSKDVEREALRYYTPKQSVRKATFNDSVKRQRLIPSHHEQQTSHVTDVQRTNLPKAGKPPVQSANIDIIDTGDSPAVKKEPQLDMKRIRRIENDIERISGLAFRLARELKAIRSGI